MRRSTILIRLSDAPCVDVALKAVRFGKITLKAVTLHLAHTLMKHIGIKTGFAGSSGDCAVGCGKFRLYKTLLAKLTEAVQIGIIDLHSHIVFFFRERKRKLIHAIEFVRTARRTEMDKCAVDKQAVKSAGCGFKRIFSGTKRLAAKADRNVSFIGKGGIPNRKRFFKKMHNFFLSLEMFYSIGNI